ASFIGVFRRPLIAWLAALNSRSAGVGCPWPAGSFPTSLALGCRIDEESAAASDADSTLEGVAGCCASEPGDVVASDFDTAGKVSSCSKPHPDHVSRSCGLAADDS